MKIIQSMADLVKLRNEGKVPLSYIEALELQFIEWYEAEGEDEDLNTFQLPSSACIYHLENQQDASLLSNQIANIEYIDHEESQECNYFRVGIMNDHQMSIVFFLEGTLGTKFEQWLRN